MKVMPGLLIMVTGLLLAACQPTAKVEAAPVIPPCLPKADMPKQLKEKFGELPFIKGTVRDGAFVTMYVGKTGWTMTRTVNDRECIWLVGQGMLTIINDKTKEEQADASDN